MQERQQLFAQACLVFERELLGVGFGEEVERVDHRHRGHQIDFDAEFARLLREYQACQIIALRILLPVDEVLVGRDFQRIGEDRCARMRCRAQTNDLRRKRDQAIIAVMRNMIEGNMN